MLENQLINSLILFPFFLYVSILISKKLNITDEPNIRKIHDTKIVNISGLVVYIFLAFAVSVTEFSSIFENIIISGFLVVLIGFIDDRFTLNPSTKLLLLILPTVYLILNGFELKDLGRYEYIDVIQLGKFSLIFTLLSVILLINAINYIDGTDGLVIGYALTAFSYFYFLSEQNNNYLQVLIIFIYFLVVCLFFNFLPSSSGLKTFVGDAGSLFIGFFVSFTMIFLYKYQNIHPAFLIWSCWFPIYDFLYVTYNRIKYRIDFSKPDKSHFHHDVLNYFFNNHFKTFLFVNSINVIVIIIGYLVCLIIGKIYSLVLFAALFMPFVYFRLIFKSLLKKSKL